jgi:Alginate lyase
MSKLSNSISSIIFKAFKELIRFRNRRLWFLFGKPQQLPIRISHIKYKSPKSHVLEKKYRESDVAKLRNTLVLYRIIGNDLTPRHLPGQSYKNLRFILEHEPSFPNCEKRWIVNRIFDSDEEAKILSLLEKYDQPQLRIPFLECEYSEIHWDTTGLPSTEFLFGNKRKSVDEQTQLIMDMHLRRHKNNYVMNNNGARNIAIRDGRNKAKWILPFDGNCFFTAEGFELLRSAILAAPWHRYFIVPLARIEKNELLLEPDFSPEATEEPQIVFRTDSAETFDESIPYGRRPKVELLWRLGVRGAWDRYHFFSWESGRPVYSAEVGQFKEAAWIGRLFSGRADLEKGEKSFLSRGMERSRAIIKTLDTLDGKVLASVLDPDDFAYYDVKKIENAGKEKNGVVDELERCAEEALAEGTFSVLQKTTLAPSGNKNDYWHPAPYWWPNPDSADGLPYVWRDGERLPGTQLYQADCERYDRTALQKMFDNCTVLSLAGSILDEERFLAHAATLVRVWFIDPQTRMNPHLKYAQVRRGHNSDLGTGTGIIEFKDVYYFLDAIRMLKRKNSLSQVEVSQLTEWFREYFEWLLESPAGINECAAANNHGTFFDVQCAAIARFIGDTYNLAKIKNRAEFRLFSQIDPEGAQLYELQRTRPRHYVAFGLISWTILARILEPLGANLWNVRDPDGRCMEKIFQWFYDAQDNYLWPAREVADFPVDRFDPIWADLSRRYPDLVCKTSQESEVSMNILHPDFGVAPFWVFAKD